jgi:proline iminopeptidase
LSAKTILALTMFLAGCANTGTRHVKEGYVNVTGGRVWYRMVGGDNRFARTPLLVVHGGPGMPHDYLEPLEALADQRPVIFYDQLGCGRSDRPSDDALWNVPRFVQELQQVRDQLKLKEVMIYAHSTWGSVLATEYLLQQPDGVRGVVFAGPAFSIPRYEQDVQRLIAQLPVPMQDAIHRHERDGTTDSPEYQQAAELFNHRHICRAEPWPKALTDALKGVGNDVCRALFGPNEFTVTGRLRGYDRTNVLGRIQTPVLLTCGKYDVTTPESGLYYAGLLPHARLQVYVKSAHMPHLEETEQYLIDLRKFINENDPHREKEFFETQ